WQGRAITGAIAAYGATVTVFGVVVLIALLTGGASEDEPRFALLALATLMLALSGAADNVSAVFRATILQVAAPDHMRGRMQGISTIVVTGGPRVGDLWAGILTATIALWAPAILGGLIICAIMGVFAKTLTTFQHYDAHNPTP